jgi:hypothetical protein
MNFTPLDSSRQRASFQIKIFGNSQKNIFFYFRRFLAQKKLLDERNPKCFVTLVTYCYNNIFVYFNLQLTLTGVGEYGPKSLNNGVMAV